MNPLARARHLLARRPWIYWAVVAAFAATAAWSVLAALDGVDGARRAWGEGRTVLVAADDIAPGDAIADHVEAATRPAPVVPDAALRELPDDAVARQHVAAGEVLVGPDVAPRAGPQALIPPGWLGVAVAEAVPSGARPGDRVRAVSSGVVVATDGLVVDAGEAALVVAVPAGDAAAVAAGSTAGDLTLLLVP